MWSPTHVQVTVQRARGLISKGKNGTNDAFVTIGLGKEKYQTSVKEKAEKDVEWREECELLIPKQGNTAEIVLTVLHRNFIGVDEFLGMVSVPLAEFDVYERPRNRWYTLKSKPGKEKNKPRGELEVKIAFTVKAGSLTDLSKKEKHKSSLGQLSHMAQSVGGSLLSIGSLEKRKGLKKLAKSIGHKMGKGHKEQDSEDKFRPMSGGVSGSYLRSAQVAGDADPGVISEDEDEFTFDDLSHKSSESSLNTNNATTTPVVGSLENLAGGEFLRRTTVSAMPPAKPPRNTLSHEKHMDEWEQKLFGKQGKESSIASMETLKRRSWENNKPLFNSQGSEKETVEAIAGSDIPSAATTSSTNIPATSSVKKLIEENSLMQSVNASQEKEKLEEREKEPEKEKEKEMSKLARKFKNFRRETKLPETVSELKSALAEERIIIGGETDGATRSSTGRLSAEVLHKFEGKSREDLIDMVCNLQAQVEGQNKKMRDLEDYLDNLLLRVMETTPRILQNPYVSCKTQAKVS
ncbi:hypothetical protein R5R35_010278 [Gryllus longicercus]|uniref:Uncharacterized protein n=1 Tax=Gryllus longicercus TaxID=2509291 RepID=A0AAN9V364_9ORTH